MANYKLGVLASGNFWNHVAVTADPDRCWNWLLSVTNLGYGQVSYQYKGYTSHRIAWELFHSRKPVGWVLHSCDNRRCCNPGHLREGTPKDNSRDMVVRQRMAMKLDPDAVKTIRSLAGSGVARKILAIRFGVSKNCISDVVKMNTWKHVD